MYPVMFTMTDSATGITVTARTRFLVPSWIRDRSQLVLAHFARIWCGEQARRYFGTNDVWVALREVNGIEYAY